MSRIILKISGEILKEDDEFVSHNALDKIKEMITILKANNQQIGIVVGGGNFFRGRCHPEMAPLTRDTIGLMGTVMNALYIHDYLEKNNIASIVSTPFDFPYLLENFSDKELKEHLANNEVVIFGGGTGKSGFTTDSGAVLALKKLNADLIVKLTNVSGVYKSDPKINKTAEKIDHLTFKEALQNDYKVMDRYAFLECAKLNAKIIVMNFNDYKSIYDQISRKVNIGTYIEGD